MRAEVTTSGENLGVRVLFVDTGRKYELEAHYGAKLRLLSARCFGDVVTSGQHAQLQLGRFCVNSSPRPSSKLAAIVRTLSAAGRIVRAAAAAGKPVQLIISYDPLTTGLLGLMLSGVFGIPLLVEVNGDFTADANYEDVRNPYKRALKKKVYVAVEHFVLRRCAGIKLLHASQLGRFARSLPAKISVQVYPNFLDVSAFCDLGESKRVAIVGFPFGVKGVDIAVNAFKQISDEFPDWSMDVLGWYANEEKALLDRCIGDHPRIKHHPPVFRQAMAEYIGTCGVVVCASRTEGFPRVIKEAMHAGKPCVVSDVGGLPEAVKHNVNGLVFRSENVDELAGNLRRLLRDPSLRQSLGAAAQVYAEQEYSSDSYLERFAAHVESIVKSSRRTA
jgi:glycosyltransferase involved in cell wall biosynthesis